MTPGSFLPGPLSYWNHVDGGVAEFPNGSPLGAEEGGSANVSLLLALALERTAELAQLASRAGEREFYLAQTQAGLGDLVLPRLDRWKQFVAAGLTTFPEHGVESRSDCHAWSAHPLYALLATTCGIRPASPNFKSVVIAPAPGTLTEFSGEMPNPKGTIQVKFSRQADTMRYTIHLPEGLPAIFRAHGQEITLHAGENTVTIPAR